MKFKDIRPNKNESYQDYMKRLFDETPESREKAFRERRKHNHITVSKMGNNPEFAKLMG